MDGKVFDLDEEIELDRYKIHNIEAVVDRVIIKHPEDEEGTQSLHQPAG